VNSGTGTRTLTLTGNDSGSNNFYLVLTDQSTNKSSLTKSGTGQWILNTTETYTGNTTVSAGTLTLNGSSLLVSTGNLAVSGGNFAMGGFNNTFANLSLTGGNVTGGASVLTVNSAGTFALQSGTISAILAGTGALNKTTSGTVTLGGVNTFTGVDTISGGTLNVANFANGGSNSGLGASTSAAANLVLSSGTLQYTGATDATTDRLFTLGTGATAGALDASGIGNLTLSNGGSIVNSGTGTRTLTLTGNDAGSNNFDLVLADQSTNKSSLTKSGTGQWNLNTAETFTGTTTVSGGTLQLNNTLASLINTINGGNLAVSNNNQLASTAAVTVSGGTLAMSTFNNTLGGLTLSGGIVSGSGILTVNSAGTFAIQSGTDSAVLAGTGALNKTTSGTATLNGVNSYSGITTISAGTLSVANLTNGGSNSGVGSSSAAATNLVLNGGTLQFTGATDMTTNRDFSLGTSGGAFDSSGTGNLTLGNTSSVTISGTGTRTLTLTGSNAGTNIFDPAVADQSTNKTSLTKSGAGQWILNDAETYTGTTTVSGGTLQLNNTLASLIYTISGGTLAVSANNQLASTAAVTVSGGTLAMGTLNNTLGSLTLSSGRITGTGTLTSSGTFALQGGTDSAILAGTGALSKTTAGTVTLNAANTYSGGTTISAGTLQLSGSGNLGASSNALTLSGGTLDLGGSTGISVGTFTLSGGTLSDGTLIGTSYAFQSGTESANAILAGASALTKTTTGLLTLAGANTYSGGTNINAGTINFSSINNFGTGGISLSGGTLQFGSGVTADISALAITIGSGGGTIDTNGNNVSLANSIGNNGSGSLTKAGNGILALDAAGTYTGGTTISAGTLLLGNAGALGSTSSTLTISGGTVDLGGFAGVSVGSVNLTGGTLSNGTLTGTSYAFQSGTESANAILAGSSALTKTTTGLLTLAGANTYSGGTNLNAGTINFSALNNFGTGGISFGGGTLQYAPGNTLDISSLALTFGSTAIIDTNGNNVTFANSIGNAGVGGLTKIGNGALTLAAANTYTGTTALNAGTLRLSGSGTLGNGTSAVTISGGVLDLDGQTTVTAGTFTLAGGTLANGTLTATSYALQSGFEADNAVMAGSGAATKTTTGLVTLNGTNTYSGGTNLNVGTINFSTLSNLGTGGLSFGGGTLQYASGSTVDISSRTVTLAAGGGTIDTNGNNVSFANAIGNSGTGGLTKTGLGNLTLSAVNTYTSTTSVNEGTLLLDLSTNPTGVVSAASNLALGGGTLVVQGNNTVSSTQTLGSVTLSANTGSSIVVNSNGGSGTALTLGNTWTSNNGVVFIDVSAPGASVASNPALTNGILGYATVYDGTNYGFAMVDGSGNLVPFTSGDANGLPSSGTSATTNYSTFSSFTMTGTNHSVNSLILDTTSETSGSLALSSATRVLTITTGGILMIGDAQFVLSTGEYGASGSTVMIHQMGTGNGQLFISGTISGGAGKLIKDGPGYVLLEDSNTYTGGTFVDGGTVSLGGTSAAGTGPVTVNNSILQLNFVGTFGFSGLTLGNGTLQYVPTVTTDLSTHTITFGTGGATIDTDVNNVTYANAIGNNGVGGLTKIGSGNLTLSGANTYTGDTLIGNGFLVLNNSAALQNTTLNYNNSGGSLSFGTLTSATLGGLKGSQDLVLANATSAAVALTVANSLSNTYSGNLSGIGSLTDNGTGNLTLAGNNTYTGGTTINNGTLIFTGNTSNLGAGITDNAVLVFNQAVDSTFAGPISGPGTLTKIGSGNLTLSGVDTYSGDTLIGNGRLILNNIAALQNSTLNYNNAGGTLSFGTLTSATLGGLKGSQDLALVNTNSAAVALTVANSISNTYSGNLSGAGSLTDNGPGSLTLSGNNTYVGATTVNDGTLIFTGNTSNLGAGITDNATLVFNQASNSSFAGAITGSGALTKAGNGNLTLTGSSSYAGGTRVSNGTLIVDGTANGAISHPGADVTLGVGAGDNAGLILQNSAVVTEDNGYFGGVSGSTGTVLVTGTGSTMNVDGNLAVGFNGAAALTIFNGGQVHLIGSAEIAAQMSGFSSTSVSGFGSEWTIQGSLTVGNLGAGNLNVDSGGLVSVGGSLILAAGGGSSANLNLNNGGTLSVGGVNGIQVGLGSYNVNLDGGTLQVSGSDLTTSTIVNLGASTTSTINTAGFNAVSTGGIGGGGALVKTGNGTLTLGGNNTFTGGATVSNGALVVNGLVTASTITVSGSHAALGGNGTVNNVIVTNGATLSPGLANSVNSGTVSGFSSLTVSGNLSWNADGASANVWHLSTGNIGTTGLATNITDTLNVLGSLTNASSPGTSIVFDFADTGYFDTTNSSTSNVYTLLTSSSNLTSDGFTSDQFHAINIGAGDMYKGLTYFMFGNGGTSLQFVIVPEPSVCGLVAGLLALTLGLRRRRRR